MNKNIGIALLALLAFTGVTANAQTDGTTSVDATVTTTNATTGATETVGLPPKPTLYGQPRQPLPPTGVRPGVPNTREAMEAREKALRAGVTVPKQTQGATFGEKARLGATTTPAMRDAREGRQENREEMEKRAKEMRKEVEKKRGEIKDEQMKKRLEIARKKTELVSMRLEQAIARVQKLSDRVAERLTKLEAEGVIADVSRGHLADAKTKLDEARTKAAGVKVAIETAFITATLNAGATTTPGTAPKNVMKETQEAVREAAKVIQEAHKHVALAISTVKPGQNKPRPATTTPTTTTPATTSAETTQ